MPHPDSDTAWQPFSLIADRGPTAVAVAAKDGTIAVFKECLPAVGDLPSGWGEWPLGADLSDDGPF